MAARRPGAAAIATTFRMTTALNFMPDPTPLSKRPVSQQIAKVQGYIVRHFGDYVVSRDLLVKPKLLRYGDNDIPSR